MSASNVDLLTLGESMMRFSVPSGRLLADAPVFDVHVAGTESNVAVAVSRMGFTSRWLSRLPNNILGHRIADDCFRPGSRLFSDCLVRYRTSRALLFGVRRFSETDESVV